MKVSWETVGLIWDGGPCMFKMWKVKITQEKGRRTAIKEGCVCELKDVKGGGKKEISHWKFFISKIKNGHVSNFSPAEQFLMCFF